MFSLQSELATLIGVLSLTARILLLLAGLLAAALLLLAGLLTRVRGLLTRVLILSAHSGISLARGSLGQPSCHLVVKEHLFQIDHSMASVWCEHGGRNRGTKLALYKALWPQPVLLPPLVPTVRK